MRLPRPTMPRPRSCAAFKTIVMALTLTGALGAQAQTNERTLLDSTPLVLKDGRIAKISVHAFPFPSRVSVLEASEEAAVAALIREVATDCFLTAQVIGHVGLEEVAATGASNTLRLARARADAVHASLIANGLPAKATASAWDWQFVVREPRATLWLFQLIEGETCEGRPLDPNPSPLGAEAGGEPGLADASGANAPARRRHVVPAGPAPEQSHMSEGTRPLPAGSVDKRAEQKELATAVLVPKLKPKSRAAPDNVAGQSLHSVGDTVTITFAINSSDIPSSSRRELAFLLNRLSNGGRQRVQLDVSVSSSTKVAGANTADEAVRYNEWLAKRRRDRVVEWLEQRINTSEVKIGSAFINNDNSRQVVVRLTPITS